MANDDEAARKERAESLRKRIGELVSSTTEPEAALPGDSEINTGDLVSDEKHADKEAPSDQNPREFIHRRMRELDRHKR
jgi:hypothetical protein